MLELSDNAAGEMASAFTEDQAREAFRYFDRDGDGHVSHAELSHMIQSLGSGVDGAMDIDEMMKAAGDGTSDKVTYEQFVKVVLSTDSKTAEWRKLLQAELIELCKPHPWAKFQLDKLPERNGTRKRYHADTKTWEEELR